MKIVLTGATGFIGRRLFRELRAGGHDLHILGRKRLYPDAQFTEWDAQSPARPPAAAFEGADAVIHLAGTPVAQRWTDEAKQRIRDTRVQGTKRLVETMKMVGQPPAVMICASAVGIYGSRGDEVLTERSRPGQGFLADVCMEWELEADGAGAFGVRVVKLRIGVALGREGGALARMLPAFGAGAGGRLGSGRQWMSWIHADDLVGLIRFALEQRSVCGVLNATAPNPVTNAEFTSALGRVLVRPTVVFVPGFVLKMLLGEMSEVLLSSQRVLPEAAQAAGFAFRYPLIEPALRNALQSR